MGPDEESKGYSSFESKGFDELGRQGAGHEAYDGVWRDDIRARASLFKWNRGKRGGPRGKKEGRRERGMMPTGEGGGGKRKRIWLLTLFSLTMLQRGVCTSHGLTGSSIV